nr:reverse transcriptase domain-containing protein [Tanacetum cinerariifolium]
MSTSTHHIIVPSYSDIEDAFSSTNTPDYTPASPDYFPALPGNTSSDPSEDLSKYLLASLAISPFYDYQYIKFMQAYNATSNESLIPPQAPIDPPTVLPLFLVFKTGESSHVTHLERHEEQIDAILNHLDELPLEHTGHIEDKIEAMTQATIRKLVADSVAAALEAQAATMANTNNTNRNTGQRRTHVARKCSYKEFTRCQPFKFKGTEGVVGLIRWFKRTESVFSRSNSTEDCKVKFAT